MCMCSLCGYITHNEAEYMLTYGNHDAMKLNVCKWCLQDLSLLGFKINQTVRLEPSKPALRVPLSHVVLGPVYTFWRLLNGS